MTPDPERVAARPDVRETMAIFADYVARSTADEADHEPLVTALYQFGRDLGPSDRNYVEVVLADYVLTGWIEARRD